MKTVSMMRVGSWLAFCAALAAAACNGTSTGNPMQSGTAGSPNVPQEAQLLKSDLARETDPDVSQEDVLALGADNRAFAFDLYRQLSSGKDENLFFSPFSISVALAMTYPGAKGETKTQIGDVLRFELPEPTLHAAFNRVLRDLDGREEELQPDSSGSGFTLRLVNQAWGQSDYPFLDSYLDVLAQNYGAGLFAVDFVGFPEPSRQVINEWVEERTESRIKELLPPDSITVLTRLVLTNAIYFKGNWLNQFDVENTSEAVFHAPGGERVVPMMNQELVAFYAEGPGYQALELPYLSPAVRMLLILPSEDGFASFSSGLNEASFDEIRAGLSEYEVTLGLPKFSFESENRLKEALSVLGMPLPFTKGRADFTAIAGGVEPLWIDEVYHKAFVAVDEEGTEAAAATAVVIVTESAKPSVSITFDRPFVFAIYDEPTGQILFLGHVLDPG